MEQKWAVKIVVASAGDVQAERDALEQTVSSLNWLMRHAGDPYFIELWRWETDTHPGIHSEGSQGLIDSLLHIEEADILIGIFWSRFGTPVQDAGSGTEHEIRKAIASFKSKGSPQVMLYFKQNHRKSRTTTGSQFDALQGFKNEFKEETDPKNRPLLHEYTGTARDFAKTVHDHLWILVQELSRKRPNSDTNSLQVFIETTPLVARQEGLTELIGDLYLRCKFNSVWRPECHLWFGVIVSFTNPITSRLSRKSSDIIIVGEPILFELSSGRPGVQVVGNIQGSSVVFGYIPLHNLGPHEERKFQISNIRVNAATFSLGARIAALVSVSGSAVDDSSPVLGMVHRGLIFEVKRTNDNEPTFSVSTSSPTHRLPLQKVGILRFAEGFANAFKTRSVVDVGNYPVDRSVTMGEGYAGILPVNVSGSFADHGTCLKAVFTNVPAGVNLFVPAKCQGGSGLRIEMIEGESLAAPERYMIANTEVTKLEAASANTSVRVAVWEVVQPATNWSREASSIEVPVFASTNPASEVTLPRLGTVFVNGSFAPTSTVMSASLSEPVPRFLDASKSVPLLKVEA